MQSADMEVRLTFAYSLDEWKAIVRLYDSLSQRSWSDWVLFGIYVILGGYELFLGLTLFQAFVLYGSLFNEAVTNLLWATLWLVLAAFVWFSPIRKFRRWRYFRKMASTPPKTFEFTFSQREAEYRLISDLSIQKLKVTWDAFSRLVENSEAILLVHSDASFWGIPKRRFASNLEVETVRQWAQSGIGMSGNND
jgi:hypothetical protein